MLGTDIFLLCVADGSRAKAIKIWLVMAELSWGFPTTPQCINFKCRWPSFQFVNCSVLCMNTADLRDEERDVFHDTQTFSAPFLEDCNTTTALCNA